MTEKTRAEQRAESYAETARSYGLSAQVNVTHEPARHYTHEPSRVMIPGQVYAQLVVREEAGVYGEELTAHWVSSLPAPGHRASTRWVSGQRHSFGGGWPKLASEREFAHRLHAYASLAVQGS